MLFAFMAGALATVALELVLHHTHDNHGSELMLGLAFLAAGLAATFWHQRDPHAD